MEKRIFPQSILLDVRSEVMEFVNIFNPGTRPDLNDIVFVEEVLTSISSCFYRFETFRRDLINVLEIFIDGTIRYDDENLKHPSLMAQAVIELGDAVMLRLMNEGCYVNGYFPYLFKQLTSNCVLVFSYAPELVGDRYWDPNDNNLFKDTSSWLR